MRMYETWDFPARSLDGFCNDSKHTTFSQRLNNFYEFILDHIPDNICKKTRATYGDDAPYHFFRVSLFANATDETCKHCLHIFEPLYLSDKDYFIKMAKPIINSSSREFIEYAIRLKINNDPEWAIDMLELIYEIRGYCYGMDMNKQIEGIKIILGIADIEEMNRLFLTSDFPTKMKFYGNVQKMLGPLYEKVCR